MPDKYREVRRSATELLGQAFADLGRNRVRSNANGQSRSAIDRLRDIARRAILARLFLATGSNAIWPLGVGSDMDRRLTDDQERRRLRSQWRRGMASVGLSRGCEKADRPHVLGNGTKA
jgi:hypothetical protein